jgi:hypothetical protein
MIGAARVQGVCGMKLTGERVVQNRLLAQGTAQL